MLEAFGKFITGGERVRQARAKIESFKRREIVNGVLKPRHKAEFDRARSITRRHALKLLGLGAAGVAIPGLAVSIVSKPPPMQFLQAPDAEDPDTQFLQAIEFQEHHKKRTLQALQRFQNVNPETQKLFKMLQEHAVYALPIGPVITQRIVLPTNQDTPLQEMFGDPHEFEVVFMPEKFASYLASPVVFGDNSLRIAADITSDDWLAILIYHELSHTWDLHFGGENPNNPDEWTDGEVRAHELENKLIRHWKPEAYDQLIALGIPLWRSKNFRGIMNLADRLFPPPSNSKIAKGQMYGALIICIAFEDARKSGRDLRQVYRNEILPTHLTAQ